MKYCFDVVDCCTASLVRSHSTVLPFCLSSIVSDTNLQSVVSVYSVHLLKSMHCK